VEVKELQHRIEGVLTAEADEGYESLRRQMIWNQLTIVILCGPQYKRL